MSKQQPFIDPYLSLYAFFNAKHGQEMAHQWRNALAEHIEASPEYQPTHENPDPEEPICHIYKQHDAWVVYVSVDKKGPHPQSVWPVLGTMLFGAHNDWQVLNRRLIGAEWPQRTDQFWGMSILFGADVAFELPEASIDEWLSNIPLPPECNLLELTSLLSEQKWGTIWHLHSLSERIYQSPHLYAVLAKEEHTDDVADILFGINHMDVVELSLHKSYQQLKHYEANRTILYDLLDHLDQQLEELIETEQPTRDVLTAFSKEHFEFSKLSSNTFELQNTVNINRKNYRRTAKELGLFGTQDDIFSAHSKQLRTGCDQLKADQIYYEAALRRFETGLQAVRANLELLLVEQEQSEAKRDKQRDFILGLIGVALSATQIWPILDKWYELHETIPLSFLSTRLYIILGTLAIIMISIVALVVWGIKQFFSDK